MKLLVLSETYPHTNSIYQMAYVHSRNIQYKKQGVEVEVLSFSAKSAYEYENIAVLPPTAHIDFSNYDAVVSHAPNIRNHYKILRKNLSKIKNLILFFHGHEALVMEQYYPTPYPWQKQPNKISLLLRRAYDHLKLYLLRNLLNKENVRAIYVSKWMRSEATHCMKLDKQIDSKNIIIHNAINESFYKKRYTPTSNFLADFITIRPLDGAKYAVDKVVQLAENNPDFSFHIYGKGDYFKHNTLPSNVEVFDTFIEQKNIPSLLDQYRAAIMPTRLDAQGVMMCEMASYGIPTIVSDLPVCREMLSEFSNCTFIKNSKFQNTNLNNIPLTPLQDFSVIQKFSPDYLAKKELEFIFQN